MAMVASSFKHNCVHVFCKVIHLDSEVAKRLEFDWLVLGLKFAMLFRISSRLLRRKLIKGLLPDNLKILLRNGTVDHSILHEIYVRKIYEKHYSPKLGDVVFDLGSHIGIFTLKASRLVGYAGLVYAFEPDPENFMLLKRNIALNKVSNLKIFNKAVSSRNGSLQLYIYPSNTGGSSVQYPRDGACKMPVSSVTLDHIIQKHNIQKVNLLKVDVEGHELEVLRGATHFLNLCKQIAIETHESQGGPSNAQITEELRKYAFTIEIFHYSDNNDIVYGWK